MAKRLTGKQTKFVKEYVKNRVKNVNGAGTKAAKAAYDVKNDATANVISVENLQKPTVREAIETALAKRNITIDSAIEPIAEALKATKSYNNQKELVESDIPDHSIRLKGANSVLELLGAKKTAPLGIHFHQHIQDKRDKYNV